ncbi:MAG: hypothetical protein B6244_11715 [Candidatus Cloacimonetes bacterium 4572_55]|nr:MAG: hypothetical protein B6244_11715 [Candidatus Cloacimonetes bacterium 4572_55]
MLVGTCRIELIIQESHSLKAKRSVLNHLKDRVKNKFNVSIAEVEGQELWQRAVLGIAAVSSSSRHAEAMIEKVLRFIDNDDRVEVIKIDREIL